MAQSDASTKYTNLKEGFIETITLASVDQIQVPLESVVMTDCNSNIISGTLLSDNNFIIPSSLELPQGKYTITVTDFAANVCMQDIIVSTENPIFTNWSPALINGVLSTNSLDISNISVILNEVCIGGDTFVPFISLTIEGINRTNYASQNLMVSPTFTNGISSPITLPLSTLNPPLSIGQYALTLSDAAGNFTVQTLDLSTGTPSFTPLPSYTNLSSSLTGEINCVRLGADFLPLTNVTILNSRKEPIPGIAYGVENNGAYRFTVPTSLPDDTYTLTATDIRGNSGFSNSFTVSHVNPTLTLTSPLPANDGNVYIN